MLDAMQKIKTDDPTKKITESIRDEITDAIKNSLNTDEISENLKESLEELLKSKLKELDKISIELTVIKEALSAKKSNEELTAALIAIQQGGTKWLN